MRSVHNRFTLYSIGLNGTDEGGVVARRPNGIMNRDEGDWAFGFANDD